MQYDLFISHSSADADTARALVTDFENRGITCWLAARDVPMGGSYQVEIVSAIERCRAVLLLFSDSANRSEHVLREVELAAQGRKPIYPLRIDASEPAGGLKYMLANKQWVERKALGNRLAETVERLLASNPEAARPLAAGAGTPPPPPPQRSNRPLMIGAGVLALCLLAGGGLFAWKAEQDRQERVRIEQAEKERVAQQKTAEERAAAEKAAADKAAQERAAQERTAQERAAQERAAQERAAQERAALERAAQQRAAQEQAAKASAPQIARGAPTRAQVTPGKPYLFQECDVCPVMAAIPAGSNLIGSPETEVSRNKSEGPQQEVVIAQPFAVGRTEVSFTEWLACVAEGGCNSFKPGDQGWGYGLRPAINISWADARAYAEWLSRKTGAQYRLLSEAEWEYAARGCATICRSTPFWFGMDISRDRANYDSRYAYERSPKASLLGRTVEPTAAEPNPFGLLHVHGNVSEWVEDCWNPTLDRLPKDGSARLSGDCQTHVVRGGSWQDEPKDVRSASRSWLLATDRSGEVGFRVARTLSP